MNSSKLHPPTKKPASDITGLKKDVASRPVTPTPGKANGSGYTAKYKPPTEPVVSPAPNATMKIDVPNSMDIVTMEDLVRRIKDSASILTPGIPLKITTALTPSGVLYHALVVTPKNPERETSRWRVEVKGPAVNTDKVGETLGRRRALEALLEQLERKVGKELLG